MTTAILEIIALLTVSCLIGVFFTYKHWKAKLAIKEAELSECQSHNLAVQKDLEIARQNESKLQKELEKKLEEPDKKKAVKPDKDDSSKYKQEIKALKEEVSLQQQSLDEKEREIEELSKELAAKKISYYKQIDGKRYKAITILKADEAVAGAGDGRISKADAESIFATISDGKAYTQVEKDTMRYLRDNYNWTDAADELFRKKVRSWAAKGHELD